jgi:hypothetical protein
LTLLVFNRKVLGSTVGSQTGYISEDLFQFFLSRSKNSRDSIANPVTNTTFDIFCSPLLTIILHWLGVGRDSVFGQDGPGIELGREIFRTRPDLSWGPDSLLYSRYQFSFTGAERLMCGVKHPLPFSAEVKERVELYLHCSSGPATEELNMYIWLRWI